MKKNSNINTTYIEALVHDTTDDIYSTDSIIMRTDVSTNDDCEEVDFPGKIITITEEPTATYNADKKEVTIVDAPSSKEGDEFDVEW